jgi:bifunctional UDP-N-acetylglucosamine pyrophosphorylase/glucosamine-1-phosphate N-acetyltransferase
MAERAAVILAAGQGTRMRSPVPKVLHRVGGRTMLDRVIDTVEQLGCARIVVVVGNHSPEVRKRVVERLGEAAVAVQDPPLGTGHAVLAAEAALAGFEGDVVVTNADCPLLTPKDLEPLFRLRDGGALLALLGFEPVDPLLYGRMIRAHDGHVLRIVEPKDATQDELAIKTCYAGMLCAARADLFRWLKGLTNDNAKGEYYLTGIVHMAAMEANHKVRSVLAPESAVMGADTPAQLSAAEAIFQQRRRREILNDGVQLQAPETVFLSWDTRIAAGAMVEPYVVFGQGVTVEAGAQIRAFSHLEGAVVRAGAIVGPYARLRPGADIGEDAHIGNFVEVKKVKVGKGAKANHLSYLGDGSVGAGANIGAGVIFCNYDGFDKQETHVGENAFVGSDSSLVAPVKVGDRAYIGTGSVIVSDVPDDALALARSRQVEKPGWAENFRKAKQEARKRK